MNQTARLQLPSLRGLLRTHELNSHKTPLRRCFGDGYLYRHNPIYYRIRRSFLGLGARFTFDDFCHASVFPFLTVSEFQAKGKVVCFNNITPLRFILKTAPVDLPFRLFQRGNTAYLKNNLFHEPAHLVANQILFGLKTFRRLRPRTDIDVLKFIMAEAFAEAAETVASCFAHNEEHRLFLEFNLHHAINRTELRRRREIFSKLGPRSFFRVHFSALIFGNFACLVADSKQIKHFVSKAGFDPIFLKKHKLIINEIFQRQLVPEGLNYKLFTAELFFRMMGVEKPILETLGFNFVKYFESSQLELAINKLEEVLFSQTRF